MGLSRFLGKDKVATLSEAEASAVCFSFFKVEKNTFVPGLSSEGIPKGKDWVVKSNPNRPGAAESIVSGSKDLIHNTL